MKVKNKKTISNISKSILKGNKRRNNILILAIALTCILFTTMFTMLFGFKNIYQESTARKLGGREEATIELLSREMAEELKSDSKLKGVAEGVKIGYIESPKLAGELIEIQWGDGEFLKNRFVDLVEGESPEKSGDIVMDTQSLEYLGYPAKIGTKMNLNFEFMDKRGNEYDHSIQSREFTLSGYYKPPIESDTYKGQSYISKEDLDSLNVSKYNYVLGINNMNKWNLRENISSIVKSHGMEIEEDYATYKPGKVKVGINPANELNISNLDISVVIAAVIFLILVMGMGYLLIYNVLSISVVEDIKLYGLLKTIGATSKQLKKILIKQCLYLCVVGIPVGILIGYFVGRGFLPLILREMSYDGKGMIENISYFNVGIIIFSALFSVLTIYISCLKPAKMLKKLNPIESVNYQKINSKGSKKVPKISTLSKRYAYESKGRFFIVLLSIAMSIGILNTALSVATRLDVENMYSDELKTDYLVADGSYFRYEYGAKAKNIVDENLIKDIESQSGFINGGRILFNGYRSDNSGVWKYHLKDSEYFPVFYGMDKYLLSKQNYFEGGVSEEPNSIYYSTYEDYYSKGENLYSVGDTVTVTLGDGSLKEYKIAGVIETSPSNNARYFVMINREGVEPTGNREEDAKNEVETPNFYLNTADYIDLIGEAPVMTYSFDIEDSARESFAKYMDSKLEENPRLRYDSMDTKMKDGEKFKSAILLMGATISVILVILGCLNMVNLLTTNLIKNRREYGILEAIGLDNKQRKKMFLLQGLAFVVPSLILGIVVSVISELTIVSGVGNYLPMKGGMSFLGIGILSPILILIAIFLPYRLQKREESRSLIDRINN